MKHLLIVILLFSWALNSHAQKKEEIVDKGIEVKKFFEQDVADGEKEAYLVKEEFYSTKGELVEIKEYNSQGSVETWFKYKYDKNNVLIEELELNSKGEQIERIEYKYQNGLRTEKLEYDSKNRLSKIRKYEYGFRK